MFGGLGNLFNGGNKGGQQKGQPVKASPGGAFANPACLSFFF